MKYIMSVILLAMILISAGTSYAADDQVSLGAKAGEAARELKDTANETLSTGVMKVAESSKKVEAEAQETVKTLQQQWDEFSKQLQVKAQELQKQVQQQWQDFSKSFNQPSQ